MHEDTQRNKNKLLNLMPTHLIYKYLSLSFGFTVLFISGQAQHPDLSVSLHTNLSSGSDLPFWMVSNQNGVYSLSGSSYQLAQFSLQKRMNPDSDRDWDFSYGANLVYGYANESDWMVNQYWAGVRYHWLELEAGARSNQVIYSGLSSTNGDVLWSNNSRPLPGIRIGTNSYIPLAKNNKWLFVKMDYEELLMDDHRLHQNVHLHHKDLFFKIDLSSSWEMEAGLDHWVQWGGEGIFKNDQSVSFTDYLRYVTGQSGDGDFNPGEQNNAAGNHMGAYHLKVKKEEHNCRIAFYWNHLFDDASGREMANWEDGLWGFYWERKQEHPVFKAALYEFMNTKDQSGNYWHHDSNQTGGRGKDDYFNHFLYQSGWVGYGRMMGTPFFVPTLDKNGIPSGFKSTRMIVHHLGVRGNISSSLSWKSLCSWSRNYGTFFHPEDFPSLVDEFSCLVDLIYDSENLPFAINIGLAADTGERFEERLGAYLGISKRW